MIKLITSILTIAVAGTIFIWYTRPTYAEVSSLKAEIAQYDQALQQSREFQQLKQALLSRFNTFPGESLARLERLLPDHVDNVRLVLDLDRLAAQSGLALQNVIINRDEGGDSAEAVLGGGENAYDSLTLQFSTVGSYDAFVNFIESLERSLRIVDVTALSIDPVQSETAEPRYRYDVSLRTYWLK